MTRDGTPLPQFVQYMGPPNVRPSTYLLFLHGYSDNKSHSHFFYFTHHSFLPTTSVPDWTNPTSAFRRIPPCKLNETFYSSVSNLSSLFSWDSSSPGFRNVTFTRTKQVPCLSSFFYHRHRFGILCMTQKHLHMKPNIKILNIRRQNYKRSIIFVRSKVWNHL